VKKAITAIIPLWYIVLAVFFYILYTTCIQHSSDILQKNTDNAIKIFQSQTSVHDSFYLSSENYFPGALFAVNILHSHSYFFLIAGIIFFIIFCISNSLKIADTFINLANKKRNSPFLKKQLAFLFLILFFSPVSSQIFVKGGAVITVKNGSLHSDSIVYENKEVIKNNSKEEKIVGTIYVVKGTQVYNLSENSNIKLAYIPKKDETVSEKPEPENEVSAKPIGKKISSIPKISNKKKELFLYNQFGEHNLITDIGRRTVVAVINNVQIKNYFNGILQKNSSYTLVSSCDTAAKTFLYENFISYSVFNSFQIRPPPILFS